MEISNAYTYAKAYDLQNKKNTLKTSQEELASSNTQTTQTENNNDSRITACQQEIEQIESEIAKLESEISELNSQKAEKMQEYEEKNNQFTSESNALNKLEAQLTKQQQQSENYSKEIETLIKRAKRESEDEYNYFLSSYDEKRDGDFRTYCNKMHINVKPTIMNRIRQAQTNLDTSNSVANSISNKIASKQTSIDTISTKMNTIGQEIQTIESKCSEKQAGLTTSQANLLQANTKLDSVKAQVAAEEAAAKAAQAQQEAANQATTSTVGTGLNQTNTVNTGNNTRTTTVTVSSDDQYYCDKVNQLNSVKENGKSDWTVADVKKAFSDAGLSAEEHYNLYGKNEGLSYKPAIVKTVEIPSYNTASGIKERVEKGTQPESYSVAINSDITYDTTGKVTSYVTTSLLADKSSSSTQLEYDESDLISKKTSTNSYGKTNITSYENGLQTGRVSKNASGNVTSTTVGKETIPAKDYHSYTTYNDNGGIKSILEEIPNSSGGVNRLQAQYYDNGSTSFQSNQVLNSAGKISTETMIWYNEDGSVKTKRVYVTNSSGQKILQD